MNQIKNTEDPLYNADMKTLYKTIITNQSTDQLEKLLVVSEIPFQGEEYSLICEQLIMCIDEDINKKEETKKIYDDLLSLIQRWFNDFVNGFDGYISLLHKRIPHIVSCDQINEFCDSIRSQITFKAMKQKMFQFNGGKKNMLISVYTELANQLYERGWHLEAYNVLEACADLCGPSKKTVTSDYFAILFNLFCEADKLLFALNALYVIFLIEPNKFYLVEDEVKEMVTYIHEPKNKTYVEMEKIFFGYKIRNPDSILESLSDLAYNRTDTQKLELNYNKKYWKMIKERATVNKEEISLIPFLKKNGIEYHLVDDDIHITGNFIGFKIEDFRPKIEKKKESKVKSEERKIIKESAIVEEETQIEEPPQIKKVSKVDRFSRNYNLFRIYSNEFFGYLKDEEDKFYDQRCKTDYAIFCQEEEKNKELRMLIDNTKETISSLVTRLKEKLDVEKKKEIEKRRVTISAPEKIEDIPWRPKDIAKAREIAFGKSLNMPTNSDVYQPKVGKIDPKTKTYIPRDNTPSDIYIPSFLRKQTNNTYTPPNNNLSSNSKDSFIKDKKNSGWYKNGKKSNEKKNEELKQNENKSDDNNIYVFKPKANK
ncbi:hypothetical protein TCON_2031 [Astathelohania contejeani]|uniref:Uncharacterized protein n=1 Tax=Astathelohania contejeani TaxID=164912 RepID=A0ABQ7HXA1_9MICR|nr:hypothetical protein TCON_2031 [Thelohania contejeani]